MATADGRRRDCSPPAAAAAASSAHFPPDLIPEVARRLTTLEDFFALRAGCRAYRALLPLTPYILASQAPLLLLYHAATDSFALFNLPLRRLLRFRLPRTRLTDGQDRFIHIQSIGCRVAIDYMMELRILHPFTGEEVCFPRPPKGFTYVVLCGDLVLTWDYCYSTIHYCRLQDADWRVASISGPYCLEDLIRVNSTLYALVSTGNSIPLGYRLAVVGELSDNDDSVELEFLGGELDAPTLHMHEKSELFLFLAQCCGELILLSTLEFDPMVYHVFRWKPEEAKWERITSLGGFLLFFTAHYFVGCLGPDHPGIEGDCIYFTEDEGLWSMYSSIDGSFRRSVHVDLGEQLKGFAASGYWILPSVT